MKCEICGEYISVVYEHEHATATDGHIADCYADVEPPLLRCGCYDFEGYTSECPYHVCDGYVVRNEPPPPRPPSEFDKLVIEFIIPPMVELMSQPSILDQLRAKQKEQKCEK